VFNVVGAAVVVIAGTVVGTTPGNLRRVTQSINIKVKIHLIDTGLYLPAVQTLTPLKVTLTIVGVGFEAG
jgi:ABC-type antimicrobial peptide transport system permease subunit